MTAPTISREGIAVALASLISGLPGVKTFSRRWRKMEEVPAEDQPAVFLTPGREQPRNNQDQQPVWTYEYLVTIYAHEQDHTLAPASRLNPIMDALEAALRPVKGGPPGFPGSSQVLGDTTGRIRHAWISGPVETDEGVLGPQAVAIVPIEVEVTY